MEFIGKSVIVTGAGQGIGKAIALDLAQRGARVAVADINEVSAHQLTEEIIGLGQDALAVKVDVTNRQLIKDMVATVVGKFQSVDGLVNNVGWNIATPFMENTEDFWYKIIRLNLEGTIRCCQEVLKVMIPRKQGKIVNIGSDAARTGASGDAVYSAAKGGVIAFTKTLAREMARYHININCVSPGPTQTALVEQALTVNPNMVDILVKSTPLRRLAKPEEIANAVAFMLSDEADFITGQTLSISGGLTMI